MKSLYVQIPRNFVTRSIIRAKLRYLQPLEQFIFLFHEGSSIPQTNIDLLVESQNFLANLARNPAKFTPVYTSLPARQSQLRFDLRM